MKLTKYLLSFSILCFSCLLAMASSYAQNESPASTAAVTEDYRLGIGDVIQIMVLGEPDLSMNIQLNQRGFITYPYLGELKLVGHTVTEVKDKLESGLGGDYLVDPTVSVSVASYRTIFIGGEVVRTGALAYQPGLTVEKAIFLAGGFTERSAKNRVTVATENGEEQRVDLDYLLKPGDVINVPRRFF